MGDSPEEREWKKHLWHPHRFVEIDQPDLTYRSGDSSSRIDRVYANPHRSDHLKATWTAAALDWRQKASSHRPVEVKRVAHSMETGGRPYLRKSQPYRGGPSGGHRIGKIGWPKNTGNALLRGISSF